MLSSLQFWSVKRQCPSGLDNPLGDVSSREHQNPGFWDRKQLPSRWLMATQHSPNYRGKPTGHFSFLQVYSYFLDFFFFLDLVPWPGIKHYPPAESLTTGTPRKSHYFLDFWLLQGTGGGNMGSFQPFTSTSGYLLYTAGITERYGVFLHPAAWSVSLGPLLAIFSHGQGLLLSSSPLSTTYCSSTPITKGWKKSLN